MTVTNHHINQRNWPHDETLISIGSAFELISFCSVGEKLVKWSVYLLLFLLASAHPVAISCCHECVFFPLCLSQFSTKFVLARSGVQQYEAFIQDFFVHSTVRFRNMMHVTRDTHEGAHWQILAEFCYNRCLRIGELNPDDVGYSALPATSPHTWSEADCSACPPHWSSRWRGQTRNRSTLKRATLSQMRALCTSSWNTSMFDSTHPRPRGTGLKTLQMCRTQEGTLPFCGSGRRTRPRLSGSCLHTPPAIGHIGSWLLDREN